MNVAKATCFGSGTIGDSWALNFAWKGVPTWVYDIAEKPLEQAKNSISTSMEVLVENGILKKEELPEIWKKIFFTKNIAEALSDTDFVQECGPENYEQKWKILQSMEPLLPEKTVIATSTSGLLVTQIGKNMQHPERLVGGHPYNPPHLLPLVEVTKGEKSTQEAIQFAYDFYKELGKEPVIVKKETNGFIANRIQVAVFREIIDLVQNEVCTLEDADKAMLYGPGLRWGLLGPMTVLHLGGGVGGIYDNMRKQQESYDLRLADMADWKHFPKNLPEMAEKGMSDELLHRPQEQGRTVNEISKWRDHMLIELLKMHQKI